MEHQKYRKQVAAVILDSYGKMVVAKVNYNMIDGQVNNQKKEPEKPKKKTSVIKKLREKQRTIAVRS